VLDDVTSTYKRSEPHDVLLLPSGRLYIFGYRVTRAGALDDVCELVHPALPVSYSNRSKDQGRAQELNADLPTNTCQDPLPPIIERPFRHRSKHEDGR
jgi:hypothetical protein